MEALRFGRRFLVPDALLALVELFVVVGPPLVFFGEPRLTLPLAAAAAASLVWLAVIRAWRAPPGRAARRRLAGEMLDPAARAGAYRALLAFPRRAALLRVLLWTGV